jgi:hypothetical protein
VVEVYVPAMQNSVVGSVIVTLWDGGTVLGQIVQHHAASAGDAASQYGARKLTPSAGTHQYILKAHASAAAGHTVLAGAGGTGVPMPAFLRVRKL